MKKIIVVGSLNMDLVIKTPRIPRIGETLTGSEFLNMPGGKGANQAVAAAKLRGNVTMVGCVGNDVFGESMLENLYAYRVDTTYIRKTKQSSGIAMIYVKDGDNAIVINPGANAALDPEYVESLDKIFTKDCIVAVQLEIPMSTVDRVIRIAHRKQSTVILNPAPAASLSDELLSMVDIIIPNQTECEAISHRKADTVYDAKMAVSYFMEKGINQIIITLGKKRISIQLWVRYYS